MSEFIVGVPVAYRVMGVPVGRRKPLMHHVFEVVPFEIGRSIESEHAFDFADATVRIADGRFWFPVVGFADGRHDIARDVDGWSRGRSSIRDGGHELSVYAASAYEKRASKGATTAEDLTKLAQIVVDNRAFPTDRLQPFDMPRHLEQRFVDKEHVFVSLTAGRSQRDIFSSIVWSERETVLDRMISTMDRLAFVDGVICDSRYEPLVDIVHDELARTAGLPASRVYDRVDQSILELRSINPDRGRRLLSRPTQEGLPLSLRDLSRIRPDLLEEAAPGVDPELLPIGMSYDPAVLTLSQIWPAIDGSVTGLSLPTAYRSPEMLAACGRISATLTLAKSSPHHEVGDFDDVTNDIVLVMTEIERKGSPAYSREIGRLRAKVEVFLDRMDTISTCRSVDLDVACDPDMEVLLSPSWGPRTP